MMPEIIPIRETSVREVSIQVATAGSKFDKKFKNQTVTIAQFAERLAKPTVSQETLAQYLHMPKAQQDDIKDVGGYVGGMLKGGVRNSRSIANRSCITLDLDNAGDTSLEVVIDALKAATPGAAYVIHSTHKHRPGCVRLRWVGFLSRPVYPDEYQAIARKLASMSNIEWFDDTTYDPVRIMYWPSISRDADYVYINETGEDTGLIDADALLAAYGEDDAWKDSTLWPTSSRQQIIIQKELRNQQNPLEKKGIVGAFCRVFDIHGAIKEFLSDVYRKDGRRYTFIEGSTAKGVALYGLEGGSDNKALWAYSNHATDPASGVLCNAFDLVRLHLFGHLDEKVRRDVEGTKLPSYKAMVEKAVSVPAVAKEDANSLFPVGIDASDYFEDLGSDKDDAGVGVEIDDGVEGGPDGVDPDEWKMLLGRNKDGSLQASFGNACSLLQHEDNLKGLVYFNEFTGYREYKRKREWQDEDTAMVRKYLADQYGLNFSKADLENAILWMGAQRRYHPVREYLTSVNGTWDGVKRVDRLFLDYLSEQDNAYTRETARCWIMAACMRIWEPGYKFDYVPVISGPQGVGKSTFCSVLAKKWFGELTVFDDQKAVEQMRSCWLMELSELSVNNRHEIEEQKRFISATSSMVRLPYRHDPVRFKRHCVFIGTTNQEEYLKDSTGNRRWWPIHCHVNQIDLKRLRGEVDQIWAEAMDLCADPDATTELSPEARTVALSRQLESRVSDAWEGIVTEWLAAPAHKRRYDADWNDVRGMMPDREEDMEVRDRVCVQEIWQDCFGGKKHDLKKFDANRIAAIMDNLPHWTRKSTARFGERFGIQKGWITHSQIVPF